MKNSVDLQAFQKITTDCVRVYETFRRTEPLTSEAERILQLADSLLREAGLAYLNEGQNLDVPALPNSEQATPPEQVVENFIGVQHALVDLKQALHQLTKAYVDEQRWPDVATLVNTLSQLGENTSDFSSVVEAIEETLIPQAKELFESEEWDEGRKLLRSWLLFSPEVRIHYYTSYIDQAYALRNTQPLPELKSQLPAEASTPDLDAFIRAHIPVPWEYVIGVLSGPDFEDCCKRDSDYADARVNARSEVHQIVADPPIQTKASFVK